MATIIGTGTTARIFSDGLLSCNDTAFSGTNTIGIEGNGGLNWYSTTAEATTSDGYYYISNTGTTITTTTCYYGGTSTIITNSTDGPIYVDFVDKKRTIRDRIKQNLLIKSVSPSLDRASSPEEQRARDFLRDLITERDWRRYVTNGFIMVKGDHYWYQIFNSGRNIQVYHKGKRTHYICIHTDRTCPPTDHVLNMKLLVEIDERQIWLGGNVSSYSNNCGFAFGTEGLTVDTNYNLLEFAKLIA